MKRSATLLAALLALPACRKAETPLPPEELREPVFVAASASPREAGVGEPVLYRIRVVRRPDWKVELPRFTDRLGDFQVLESGHDGPRARGAERVEESVWARVDRFDVGSGKLPRALVVVTDPSGARSERETAELVVEIRSVLPEPKEAQAPEVLKDLKPPLLLPPEPARWQPWALGAAALLALAAALFWLRRRLERPPPPLPPPPPHSIALRALAALEDEGLLGRGEFREYYYRLSLILRHYLEARFGLNAPDRTTEEFLIEMQAGGRLADAHRELLGRFLEACDLVKFARARPAREEALQALATARSFVSETSRPKPAATEAVRS